MKWFIPMKIPITRRTALATLAATAGTASAAAAFTDRAIVSRNDEGVENMMKAQVTDPASRWLGSLPDAYQLHNPHAAAGILDVLTASFVHPESRFHGDAGIVDRLRLAAGYLERCQSPEGNVFLLTTNYNSPPDTGFVSYSVASAAYNARHQGHDEIARLYRPFLLKAGAALESGGIHTPNHRWVVSSALAQIHELYPDPRYLRRIDQWLAEGIDIDSDGQFTERSVLTYNIIVDRAFIVLAKKLNRAELLEPVRRNLHSMLYLMHADDELVSEISHRQDVNTRGDIGRYWFPMHFMAVRDGDGELAAIARRYREHYASLSLLLQYPELSQPLPVDRPLPEDYEKQMPDVGIARIRRGLTSATILLNGNSRFFTLRHGDAVLNAVRFSSAFFGKGQFVPQKSGKSGASYVLSQELEAPYYQPIDRKVAYNEWGAVRRLRRQSQICHLRQQATVTERQNGFDLRIEASGTDDVPVAVEINLREGGDLSGCAKSGHFPDTWLTTAGGTAVYRAGRNQLRIGPGQAEHAYTQMRGAADKLPGPSVYLTGYTPYDRTIHFDWEG